MIVVGMIGIMSAAVMPAMSEMIADNSQHSSAADIYFRARQARADAMLGGYATVLVYQRVAGPGAVTFLTGISSSCNRRDNVVRDAADPVTGIPVPLGWQIATALPGLRLAARGFAGYEVTAELSIPDGTPRNAWSLCYHPNGNTWSSIAFNSQPGWQIAPAVMRIERFANDGSMRGTARQIVFPIGGTARLR